MYLVTIDTGTTNTRLCLWREFTFIDSLTSPVGVRNTSIDGHNQQLVSAINQLLKELLSKHKMTESDLKLVLASGMITSNLGLFEVPHLVAPAALADFSANIQTAVIDKVSALPIHFIPGLKNSANVNDGALEARDIMRGEEVEALALLALSDRQAAVTFVLPGSHTKFVAINCEGVLVACCTTLAGELTSIVTHNTILSSSLEHQFCTELDTTYLRKGAESNQRVGLTRSLFSIRILEQNSEMSQSQLASFLLGIIVSEDIKALFYSETLAFNPKSSVGIYGQSTYSLAFKILLDDSSVSNNSFMIDDKISDNLAGYGCLLVAKEAGLF